MGIIMSKAEKKIKEAVGSKFSKKDEFKGVNSYATFKGKLGQIKWENTKKEKIIGRGGALELLAKDIRTKRSGKFYKNIYQPIMRNGIGEDTLDKLKDYVKNSKDNSELKNLKIIVVMLIWNMYEQQFSPKPSVLEVKAKGGKIPDREYMNSRESEVIVHEGTAEIGRFAFAGNANLEKVTLPNSLEIIGDSAFAGDKKLKEIVIPEKVAEIGGKAFSRCGLTKLTILGTSVDIAETAFEGCSALTEVKGNIS